jgi:hypothetical protein
MVVDVFVDTSRWLVDNDYQNRNPFVRDLLSLEIGSSHVASFFRDQAHTQVSSYTNSLYRGCVHFNANSLAGRHVSRARFDLHGGSGGWGTTCVAKYGAADHLWKPGEQLNFPGPVLGARATRVPISNST